MPEPMRETDDTTPEPSRAALAARAQAPADLPALPEVAGLAWRPLTAADIPALSVLIARLEEVDHPPYRTTAEEVAEYFDEGYHHAALGIYRLEGRGDDGGSAAGTLVGFAFARLSRADTEVKRVFLSGGLDPAWRGRGIGSAVLDWQVARARQLLATCEGADTDVAARIVVHVDDDMRSLSTLLASRGFAPRRHYSQLRRDLSLAIPEVDLDRPLSIEPWTPELDDSVRRAHNTAFHELWGTQPLSPEAWRLERSHLAPEWSFVALDRTSDRARVAGYLMSGRYEQDWPALGWTEGYTEILGVLPDWRGRHLASALLARAMRAYAEDGMQYAGLDVDSDNPTGAIGVFEHLGYEKVRSSTVHTIEV